MTELSSTDYTLFPVGCQDGKPLQTTLYVEDHPFVMEVDTGAVLSLINKSVYKSTPLFNKLPLQSLTVQLRTYMHWSVKVQSGSQVHTLPLLVVSGQGPSLLGQNWLLKLQLDWKSNFSLQSSTLQDVLDQYTTLFQESLGNLKQSNVNFFLRNGETPKFYKAFPVPLAMQQ